MRYFVFLNTELIIVIQICEVQRQLYCIGFRAITKRGRESEISMGRFLKKYREGGNVHCGARLLSVGVANVELRIDIIEIPKPKIRR